MLPIKDLNSVFTTLTDISNEAIIIFNEYGVILWTNEQARMLLGQIRESLVDINIKDLFYLFNMERAPKNMWPFPTDGSGVTIFSKIPDGSFIPVEVHCKQFFDNEKIRYILVARSTDLARQTMHERTRLVRQLRRSNIRLEGMLSIISSTLGSNDFEDLTTRVLTTLAEVMEASGALLYLVEEKGYRLMGATANTGILRVGSYFVDTFTGVPGLVDKRRQSVNIQFVEPTREEGVDPLHPVIIDHKTGERMRIKSIMSSMAQSVVGLPLFSGDSIIGVILLYWGRPHQSLPSDLLLLETVARYLSVEFTSALATMRHRKRERLEYLLTQVKELIYASHELNKDMFRKIMSLVREEIPFEYALIRTNKWNKTRVADFSSVEGKIAQYEFPFKSGLDYPQITGAIVIDQSDKIGQWVARHSDLTHGALISVGVLFEERLDILAMRPKSSVPFEDVEVEFLSKFAVTVRESVIGEQERASESKISQALQLAMKNELPQIKGVTMASLYNSATAQAVVGGDYFDIHELSDHKILVLLGDISGKGVEAASMGSLVKTATAAYAWNQMNPAEIVSSLNTLFLNFSRTESFTTLFVAIIDLVNRKGTYCSAGHPPAFYYAAHNANGAGELMMLTVQSPIVGAFEHMEYKNGTFTIAEGDILYLYTDGVTEARNPDGDFFGEERLSEEFLNVVGDGVEKLPQNILKALEAYSEGDLMDDVAMVAVRFDAPPV